MSLLDTLKKAGPLAAKTLEESDFFNDRDEIPTEIAALNIALSGDVDGGITPGLQFIAGESKTFKTAMALKLVSAYMKKFTDAICIYYDSEFGSDKNYMMVNGIPLDRTLHIPIKNVEELKFDIMKKLEAIKRGDKVIFFIDSIGNLASKKEVDDAMEEKSAADMSRAKQMKSLWRMVTPYLTMNDIPCIAINHIYMEMGLYPKAIMGGGTGGMYSANTVWIITKSQEKNTDGLQGFNFKITIEKSRRVVEKSQIALKVLFKTGISKYSGILDLALESGLVQKPSNGWYALVDQSSGELGPKRREADTDSDDFLGVVIENPSFKEFVRKKYRLTHAQMLQQEQELDNQSDLE